MRYLNGIRKVLPSKSELILRSLPRYTDHVHFEKGFKNIIKNKSVKPSDSFSFPIHVFNKFPRSVIEKLVKFSYQTLKKENELTISDYNKILGTYKLHEIDFNISDILNDMKTSNVLPNFITYSILMEIHYQRGDMESVLKLFNIIKEKYYLKQQLKQLMYCAYIKSGRVSEAEPYLKDNIIYDKNFNFLRLKAKAYADTKMFSEVMKIVKEFPDDNLNRKNGILNIIHWRLAKAGASKSELNEIMAMVDMTKRSSLWNLIYNLNREGLYIHAIEILNQLHGLIENKVLFNDLILSFNKPDCPIDMYKNILQKFAHRISFMQMHLFSNMDYNSALELTVDIVKQKNTYCLVPSLMKNSFQGYNSQKICQILNFGLENNRYEEKIFLIAFVFIPGLFETGIVKNYQEVLQITPEHNWIILPTLFMYLLLNGDFASFRSLLQEYPDSHFEHFPVFIQNAKIFLNNSSFNELIKLTEEASKIFKEHVVNYLKGVIITEQIIQLSNIDDIKGIKEAVEMARNLNVTFKSKQIEYTNKMAPDYGELLREFQSTKDDKDAFNVSVDSVNVVS